MAVTEIATAVAMRAQIRIIRQHPQKKTENSRVQKVHGSDCRKSPVKPGFFVVCGGKKWYNINKEKKQGG